MFTFSNTYADLPPRFYERLAPTPVRAPKLLLFNSDLAHELGLNGSEPDAAVFAGNTVPNGAQPLAMAYAGHQFGSFVPSLGDGRAHLLGEVIDRSGQRRDIQLKGSGQTAFSRRGDGRAALAPVLREYLVSEAMHALGLPTTRSLAAASTGEMVEREEPLPGGILTRVAASHLRIGTFQYFAARGDTEGVQTLLDYATARHYPQASTPLQFLAAVIDKQAQLVAAWLGVGFIHGVMNTDNTSISGETIDYGPCAFMDDYDPQTVFSYIDQHGRYAYANQPTIMQWNLARLAECLLPLIVSNEEQAAEQATATLQTFAPKFEQAWLQTMQRKLGIPEGQAEQTQQLTGTLLQHMQQTSSDFTNTFRSLWRLAASGAADEENSTSLPAEWLKAWRHALEQEPHTLERRLEAMRLANPAYIPRNHRVEQALQAAYEYNLEPLQTLMAILKRPYDEQPEHAAYRQPPMPQERVANTFCGT